VFGNNIANTQTFTGSVSITGSALNVNNGGLFVSSSGYVGIGTSSPINTSAKLEIKGDLFLTPSASLSSKLHLYNNDSSNETYIYDSGSSSNSALVFAPGGSTKMVINSSGNISMGTTISTWKLTVAGGADSLSNILGIFNAGITGTTAIGKGTAIVLGGNTDGNYSAKIAMVYEGQNPSYLQPSLAFYTMDGTYAYGSEVERMRVSSTGNVLIGSTASTSSMNQTGRLQVAGGVRATSGLLTVYELGTITQNTTITQDIPYNGLWLLTNGGNNSALIMVTRAGGSRGCQLVSSTNGSGDIVVGTTAEPSGGTYLRVWMSAVGTMSIKNVNAYPGPYSMTPISTQ
jgi:hypothetical protein